MEEIVVSIEEATWRDMAFFRFVKNQTLADGEPGVGWWEHFKWWLRAKESRWVAWVDGERVGYVRVLSQGTVSLAVVAHKQSLGIGKAMLQFLQLHTTLPILIAWIDPHNIPSLKAFTSLGFHRYPPQGQVGNLYRYVWVRAKMKGIE